MDSKQLLEDIKPEVKGIAKKVYGFSKQALVEAAKESKTPLDDLALDALIKSFESKILAKIESM
jgi:hypothetical protein